MPCKYLLLIITQQPITTEFSTNKPIKKMVTTRSNSQVGDSQPPQSDQTHNNSITEPARSIETSNLTVPQLLALLKSRLTGPFSELPEYYHIPLVNIATYIRRSVETRQVEATYRRPALAKRMWIPRPWTLFDLYRICYIERVKVFCKGITTHPLCLRGICSAGWVRETPTVKKQFRKWANVERRGHEEAFPNWRVLRKQMNAARKAARKAARDGSGDNAPTRAPAADMAMAGTGYMPPTTDWWMPDQIPFQPVADYPENDWSPQVSDPQQQTVPQPQFHQEGAMSVSSQEMEIDPTLFDMSEFPQDMEIDPALFDMSEFPPDMAIATAAFLDMSDFPQDMNTNPPVFDIPELPQDMAINPAALLDMPEFPQEMEIDPALLDMPKFLQDMAFDTAPFLDMSEFPQGMGNDPAALLASPTMLGSFTDNTQGSLSAATTTTANMADNNILSPWFVMIILAVRLQTSLPSQTTSFEGCCATYSTALTGTMSLDCSKPF